MVVSHRKKPPPKTDVQLSARNQLKGKVTSVKTDELMAEVTVDIGGNELVSAITKGSVKADDAVTVLIKASEVLIGK
jgi:molybdopterin-binding protein